MEPYEWASVGLGALALGVGVANLVVLVKTLRAVRRYTEAAEQQVKAANAQVRVSEETAQTAMRAAQAALEQAEGTEKPCLVVDPPPATADHTSRRHLMAYVRNIGNGPAVNISGQVTFGTTPPVSATRSETRFLQAGEIGSLSFQRLNLMDADESRLDLFYESMSGRTYESLVIFARDEATSFTFRPLPPDQLA